MSSLAQIKTAIAATVKAANPSMNTYAKVPDVTQLPALVVGPPKANFAKAMGRGSDEWTFQLIVLVAIPTMEDAQDELDQYVTGAGVKSIRQIIWNNPTLGGTVDDSIVTAMDNYGGSYSAASIPNVGASIELVAYTSGTG